jgi:hypothetical protein
MGIRAIIGTGVAGALVAAGAALIPLTASAQPAAAKVHTLTLISVTNKSINFSKSTGGGSDVDVNAKGKAIGEDIVYFSFNPKTNLGNVSAAATVSGGIVLLTGTTANGLTYKGTVDGGFGAFKHAKGTWTGKNLNKAGTKTLITIKYTT